MTRSISFCLVLAIAAPLYAAPPPAMPDKDRSAVSARPVAVSLNQNLEASVDVGRVPADPASGLIDAIIVASMDNKRKILTANATDRAKSAITPLTAALTGVDLSDLAEQTTRKALAATSWFKPSAVAIVPGPIAKNREALFSANPSAQTGIVSYRYQMSPDFTQLRVIASLNVTKAGAVPPIYAQQVVSLIELRQRSYDHAENVARWSSNDGALAKAALAAAFARLETVLPTVLELSPAKFAAVTNKAKTGSAFAAGFYGPQLMQDEKGVVIWSKGNGFIAAQPAAD
jgi:hypothetical protein